MSRVARYFLVMIYLLVVWDTFATAQTKKQEKQNAQFQSAVAAFNAGRSDEAARQLERLLPEAAQNFQLQELLGMSYASMALDSKAVGFLAYAVRLQPDSGAARTNLAMCLARLNRNDAAGREFRKALALEPNTYAANHNLGEFYIAEGKVADGRVLLERAQQIKPSAYDNGYDLAMAELLTGQYIQAHATVKALLKQRDTGELHNLLGQTDEKQGNFVAAADEFETAAHMDPSEDNLFDWGGELLLHRTYEPAIEVYRAASQRYPKSPRLLIGLGMALYARGLYDDAIKALLAAADLDPTEARCYLFLSKAYESSPSKANDVIQRFQRYAQLEPDNAMAQYYYAMSLWKGRQTSGSELDIKQIKSLLERSIALNGSIPEAHMQLGNLYADQHMYERSIPEYVRALELNPKLADAHYRLGTDYVHMGQKGSAQAEFATYQKLRAEHISVMDKERAAVQQFVYTSKSTPPSEVSPNAR